MRSSTNTLKQLKRQFNSIFRLFRHSAAILSRKLIPTAWAEQLLINKLVSDDTYWPYSNIQMINEIEKRLYTLKDPKGTNRFLPYRWENIFNQTFDLLCFYDIKIPKNFHYLCLGAGPKNTFSLSFLFHLAGAGRTYIVEPHQSIEDYSIFYGLQAIILRYSLGLIDSKHIPKTTDLRERTATFLNSRALLRRENVSKLLNPNHAVFFNSYFEDVDIAAESIDLLTSRSTLEHVNDYTACFDQFQKVMKQGGIMYHEIGLGGHSLMDAFQHYYSEPENSEKNNYELNGLRLSDYIREFNQRGFQCTIAEKTIRSDYILDRSRMLKKFQAYSDEDLLCENAILICRKL